MHSSLSADTQVVFVGGGNMATAILRGLVAQGFPGQNITVIEPTAESRARLEQDFGVRTLAAADASLSTASVVVWAIKPQIFAEAAAPVQPHTRQALHISVAAGIPIQSIEGWVQSRRIVRCMPNTPAQIGLGIAGLVAGSAVSAEDRALTQAILSPTGQLMWVDSEQQLDALMTISGSGPAYVFFWIEALMQGGQALGLSAEQARILAAHTFVGAANLVLQSDESPELLRQRVTSKGGTTHEAITTMQERGVTEAIVAAQRACYERGVELGKQFA
mgnify:CR=1 FL=1